MGTFYKNKAKKSSKASHDSHHQPIVVLLSADSACGAELMEVGKKSQSQNKAPFRCSIENIKVTESFCTQPHRANFYMNERGEVVRHPPSQTIQRPSERGKTYYSQPPPLASLRFFPRGEFLAFYPISLKNLSFT